MSVRTYPHRNIDGWSYVLPYIQSWTIQVSFISNLLISFFFEIILRIYEMHFVVSKSYYVFTKYY